MPTDFDIRMKRYELPTQAVLPRRTYTIVRVDGKAFHTYLRGATKPFDYVFAKAMDNTAIGLCKEMAGARFAYTQSDEISILLTDFQSHNTEPWFGGEVQKICSVSASCATAHLIAQMGADRLPMFDARVFTLSDPTEVANYFIWRQRDAIRNSISMAAQSVFSAKELHQKSTSDCQEMLHSKGINWNDYPDGSKRGRLITKEMYEITYGEVLIGEPTVTTEFRSRWVAQAAPHFVIGDTGNDKVENRFLELNIPVFS